jgi:hypothetical protein
MHTVESVCAARHKSGFCQFSKMISHLLFGVRPSTFGAYAVLLLADQACSYVASHNSYEYGEVCSYRFT